MLLSLGAMSCAQAETSAAELDRRAQALAQQLRCLVCQNQTIADSHAPLAMDLKAQLREQLQAGRRDEEIIHYMTERYGDFVLYKPPLQANTWLLWAGPALLMAAALAGLVLNLRRRAREPDEAFEAAPEEEGDIR
ncbi:cytochrome c-type biogenesis protein [Paucibacter sp. DJ2R-2]|uniref:cytochrome c-type biogenesis protein n=1 Tax=Paucibacter sp. DJ2R-2 TaxID=2893558 RepID=UPI0021E49415|nr:cytochrome c-type biogenesis protein [Paucibacter sp. DJ2R-2]MCV2440207.1 cytochrome c-type biogenesis protein CcmH [Paucibacter sp. DJ2R-2]